MPLNSTRRDGFSLLEMSIVLVILGLLTAGGLSIGGIMVAQQANTSTNENLDEIQQALIDFVKTQGRLPCVAPLTVAPTDGSFGTELEAGGCLTDTTASGGSLRAVVPIVPTPSPPEPSERIIRIGGVPTRTLGLKDRMASDEFGNRFLYVVTENLTTHAGFNTATNLGQIGVRDGGGGAGFILDPASPNGGAAFMLISHGPDGKGAVRHKTNNVTNACGTGSNLDVENCDVTNTGTTAANLINFRDARFNNGDLPASFFDDFTRFMPKYRLTALAGSTGSSLWGNSGDTIFSIGSDNNTTTGNVGIGTTAPSQNLHVTTPDVGFGNQTAMQIGTGVGSLFLTHNWASISSNLRYDDGQWRYEAAGPGSMVNMSSANGDILFQTAASGAAGAAATPTERMRITSTGNVGIGTTAPGAMLDVAGGIRPGSETTVTACGLGSANGEGTQRYNSSTKIMEFCNGTAWMPIGGAVTSGEIDGGANEVVTQSITLSAPATVIFTGYGHAYYGGGAAVGIVNAGNYLQLAINGSNCANDMAFEGESGTVTFWSSATCIKRLAAGTYTLSSTHTVTDNYGGWFPKYTNRLHYMVIYH